MRIAIMLSLLLAGTLFSCGGGGGGDLNDGGGTASSLVSIAVTPVNPGMSVGSTQQLIATGTYADGSSVVLTQSVTWSSSNAAIATIDAAGIVSALSAGTTTVTATSGIISGNVTLTVTTVSTIHSPFAIYCPYGELQLDGSTFASVDDISGYLDDIGIRWIQELPIVSGYDRIPKSIHIYSRVGKDAGMNSFTIGNPSIVEAYKSALLQRIRNEPDLKYWEVDTEPDGVGGWKNNPSGYAALLKITYQTIKSACPDCVVMFGGLSGGNAALDVQSSKFLEGALMAGAEGYFDGIEFKRHHTASKDYAGIKDKYDSIGGLLAKYGSDIHSMPVFVETAMYDGDPNDPVVRPGSTLPVQSESEQAQGLIKTYLLGVSIGIERIFWNLIYERSDYEPGHADPFPQNPFNHYGLINNPTNGDGLSHKKLAYYSYKKMVEMLEGSDWKKIQTIQASGNVYIFKFMKNNAPIYAAWWDYFNETSYAPGNTKTISISGVPGSSVIVTEAVPKFSTGKDVSDYATAFRTETAAVSNGIITLRVSENPVFLTVR